MRSFAFDYFIFNAMTEVNFFAVLGIVLNKEFTSTATAQVLTNSTKVTSGNTRFVDEFKNLHPHFKVVKHRQSSLSQTAHNGTVPVLSAHGSPCTYISYLVSAR
jgi:hypothetical protein